MDYVKVEIAVDPLEPFRDILCAILAREGYESFEYTDNGIVAYVREDDFDEEVLIDIEWPTEQSSVISWDATKIPTENWNRDWESNFPPVIIDDRLRIRAPFHEKSGDFEIELEIMPQMSFGTGHHPTTALLAKELVNMEGVTGKDVLDMGCGTGVLAILAEKKGAKSVLGIDIEEWAVENAKENCDRNNCSRIEVICGDSAVLQGRHFDVILANINRNVLTADMHSFAKALNPGGSILFSGFYNPDVGSITSEAERFGLEFVESGDMNEWSFVHCKKPLRA